MDNKDDLKYAAEYNGNTLLITKSKDAQWHEVLPKIASDITETQDNNVPRETTASFPGVERIPNVSSIQFKGVNYIEVSAFEKLLDFVSQTTERDRKRIFNELFLYGESRL